MEVEAVKTTAGWTPASGQTILQVDGIVPQLNIGQMVEVVGILQRPPPAMNPGQFDEAAYYRRLRILATIKAPRAGDVQIIADNGPTPLQWLRLKARHLLAKGFSTKLLPDGILLRALLLGDHDPELRDVQQEFVRTGVAYQLNISGLHIAMLSGLIIWIGRLLCARPRVYLGAATAFLLIYSAVALPSYSGARWIVMWMVFWLGTWTRRKTDWFHLVALAVTVILVWHPADLFDAGFQLSVAVVLGLALLMPAMQKFWFSLRDPDKVIAELGIQPTILQSGWRGFAGGWRSVLGGTVIGWLVTLPLVAYHFGDLHLWAILGAILLMPIALTALVGGMLKVFLTLLAPMLAPWLATAAAGPVSLMRHVVAVLAKLPGGDMPLGAPSIWLILIYYGLLLLPLTPPTALFRGRRRWLLRLAPALGVAAILFPLSPWAPPTVGPPQLRFTLLSLGAGQCAVLEPPGGQPIIFDAGSDSVSEVAQKIIEPFFHFEGRSHVDEIFLSHGDYDHVCAAGEIASLYGVRSVMISPFFRRNSAGSATDEELLATLDRIGRTPKIIAQGDHFELAGGAKVDVLWPPTSGDLNSNNAGLVLH